MTFEIRPNLPDLATVVQLIAPRLSRLVNRIILIERRFQLYCDRAT